MLALDIISLVLLILVLGSLAYLLHRMDVSAKNKHKITAYNLLDEKNPAPKKIKDSLKILRLYGGRWHKDPEIVELIRLLSNLLNEIENTGVVPGSKIRK